jgi:3-ketosteroid 9alpha-monooxygenase subunit B
MSQNQITFTSEFIPLTITGIREEVKNFKTFFLKTSPGQEITYQPGQYLTFILPEHEFEVRRSYSIISTPGLKEPLAIGVKRVENGIFSRRLIDKIQVGDTLWTTGAGGLFTLPENVEEYKQLFFLAAGSGITPIFSLIKTVLFSLPNLPIVLIYSNRSPEETIYFKELTDLANQFPDRLKIEYIFSNSAALARAHLYKDLLVQFIRTYSIATPDELLAYVCGPLNYMRMCFYGLHSAGVPLKNVRKENFSTDKVITKAEPPDKEAHVVSVMVKDQEHIFPAQYPDTILQAAKKAGVNLPYSCEAGKCGNCAAHCKTGKVWMSYNEVLTDREINQGLILTCTGYPVGGDLKLEI